MLSICPPDQATAVAATAAAFGGLYVDANAIAPATAARIAGPHYVDGGIIGSPSPARACSVRRPRERGRRAVRGTEVDAHVLEGDPYSASALKMVYAAWTKGTAAMLLADRGGRHRPRRRERAARGVGRLGARPARPARTAQSAAAAKGWRWAGEMREIAATFEAAGAPAGLPRGRGHRVRAAERLTAKPPRPRRTAAASTPHRYGVVVDNVKVSVLL